MGAGGLDVVRPVDSEYTSGATLVRPIFCANDNTS